MGISTAPGMTSEEIVSLSRAHTLFSWSVQDALDPIAIDHAEGVYLYTPEGRRILDFNAQLMSVNIGHGDRRVIDAMHEQATEAPVRPAGVRHRDPRPARREAGRDPARRHEQGVLHARRRRGDRERDQARPPLHRPVQAPRPLPRLPRRDLRGDDADRRPRRWANEPGLVGVVRYPDTHRWGEAEPRPVAESLQGLEDVIRYEGPSSIAAVFLETIVGTNGILIPPDGYIQGVREICDRNGILMVCDEVMAGFGRTGRWFAVDHWDVVPGPHDDGQGPDVELPAAGRRRDARHHRRGHGEQDVLRRPHVQQPPGEPRRGAGDDRRLRGGRPHRQRGAARRRHARPPRGPRGQAPVASARTATSACSGSWTSSARTTRGRR